MSDDLAARARELTRKYTDEAEVYEHVWAPVLRDFSMPLLDRLPAAATSVLDVGAGVGTILSELTTRYPEATVIGFDRSHGMIGRAPAGFGRLVGEVERLPLRSESFDIVTMMFMLFHVADHHASLTNVRTSLRAGGSLGVATWGAEQHWPQMDRWHELLDERGVEPAEGILSRHEFTDDAHKVNALLTEAGFEEVEVWEQVFERYWDTDAFVEFASGMAVSKRRLDTLAEDERATFLSEARPEIEKMPDSLRLNRPAVVFATARA